MHKKNTQIVLYNIKLEYNRKLINQKATSYRSSVFFLLRVYNYKHLNLSKYGGSHYYKRSIYLS